MIRAFETLAAKANEANKPNENDYFGEDGLLYCGKCNEVKQCKVTMLEKTYTMPIMCACDKAEKAALEKYRWKERIEDMKEQAFSDGALKNCTFETDDSKGRLVSKKARQYAEEFDPAKSKWLLMYGDCGTGKSFLAACICNAVIERGFSARFTSISEIESELWAAADKGTVYNSLKKYDLLVIDDLFAERETEYMMEIVYNVVNARYNCRKPTIITANISVADLVDSPNANKKRIFSRIAELVEPWKISGKDRRLVKLKQTLLGQKSSK